MPRLSVVDLPKKQTTKTSATAQTHARESALQFVFSETRAAIRRGQQIFHVLGSVQLEAPLQWKWPDTKR